jgi:formamidopyrimidine-DNA glycosylase
MFEYPEILTIAGQMRDELIGKTVKSGKLVKKNGNMFMGDGNYPALEGGTVTQIDCLPHDFYIRLDNGYGIWFGQGGGKILYNPAASGPPKDYNILFEFTDGSSLTYAVKLYTLGVNALPHSAWQSHVDGNRKFDPLGGTSEEFVSFIKASGDEKTAVKIFLAKNVTGLMSTFSAEILLYAKIYPSTPAHKLDEGEIKRIHAAMKDVLTKARDMGGRVSEYDLYGKKGRYLAMAERKHIGEDCPVCASPLEKNSTGGVTAFCPNCQVKK